MTNIRSKRSRKPDAPGEFALVSQYYERKKYEILTDYIYIAFNLRRDASVDDDDWLVMRYVLDSNEDPTDFQWIWGDWTSRASLNWANPTA